MRKRQARLSNHYSQSLVNIANHYHVSNAKACAFGFYWLYGIHSSYDSNNWTATKARYIFMSFEDTEDQKIQEILQNLGITFSELVRKVIDSVSNDISQSKVEPYHPKVLAFFK